MCDVEKRPIVRGEVYYVMYNEAVGSEMGVGRPGIVVSSDMVNAGDLVTVVYTTTTRKTLPYTPSIISTSKPSWALCNQLVTVSRIRLGSKMCTLTEQEMERVDRGIRLCLDLIDEPAADPDSETEELNKRIAGLEEEILAKKVEIAMMEKMYDKALEMLAGVHLTKDMQKKPEAPRVRVPRIVPDEPEVDEEIDRRTAVSDDGVKGNVNTMSAKEISDRSGLPLTVAFGITGYRSKNGRFESLEDLLKTPRFTQHHLKKYGGMLTV